LHVERLVLGAPDARAAASPPIGGPNA
jgi:hypothetical protein